MDASLIEAVTRAAEAPGFVSFTVLFGFLIWLGFNRGILGFKAISDMQLETAEKIKALEVRLVKSEASEAACQQRCTDLEKRIVALEAENLHLIKGAP